MIEPCKPVQLSTATPAVPRKRIPTAFKEIGSHAFAVVTLAVAFKTMRNNHNVFAALTFLFHPIKVHEVAVAELEAGASVCTLYFSKCAWNDGLQVAIKQIPD